MLNSAEEETRVARRNAAAFAGPSSAEPDTTLLSVRPTLKFVMAGYVVAVLGAVLFAALLSMTTMPPWISVVAGLAFLLVPAFYHLRQRLVRYNLTPAMIEIDRGLVSRTTQNIPLRRIQDVTVSATGMQRLLGFGDIIIDNASEDGGKVAIRNIDSPRAFADELLKQLRRTM